VTNANAYTILNINKSHFTTLLSSDFYIFYLPTEPKLFKILKFMIAVN